MINIKKKIVVCIIISIIWIYTGNQAILFTGTDVQMFDLMKIILFNPQKLLFNNILCFTLYLYISIIDIYRIEDVIRRKGRILVDQIRIGCGVVLEYSLLLCTSIIIPLAKNLPINEKNISIFIVCFFKSFVINYMIYAVFLFIGLLVNRGISFFILIVLSLITLICWNMFDYYYDLCNNFVITQNVVVQIIIILIATVGCHMLLENKEYY
ncbi:MAG: hypothetical protein J6L69_06895 [Lachnospiraceae bacterium]|nr:hypothetical protein [Lachnospiraceae bacterium]